MNKPQIQFISLAPEELSEMISNTVKECLKELKPISSTIEPQTVKEFLTRKETAELFNVSLVTIHDWQNNGILKVYKMGTRSFFKYSELLETLYQSNRA